LNAQAATMHAFAGFVLPAQTTINTLLWTLSIALQLALIAALFSRGLVRRAPVFTVLIAFYLVRSVLLYAIFHHMNVVSYHALYDSLQLTGLVVEAAVAIEIAVHLARSRAEQTLLNGLAPVALLALAVLCTALATMLLPEHAPIPTDRAQLFFSFLMVLLFAWSLTTAATLTRNIAAGFALYSIADLSASFGRTYAALHQNAAAYELWSYVVAVLYIFVVLYWLVTLKDHEHRALDSASPTINRTRDDHDGDEV